MKEISLCSRWLLYIKVGPKELLHTLKYFHFLSEMSNLLLFVYQELISKPNEAIPNKYIFKGIRSLLTLQCQLKEAFEFFKKTNYLWI